MALITDEPRSASVHAAKDCNLIVITRQAFRSKLEKSDPTIRAVVKMFVKRLQNVNLAVFGKKDEKADLRDAVEKSYQNKLESLPRTQQTKFKKEIGSKLEKFLDALESFGSEKKQTRQIKSFMDDDDFM
jgi:CRP-like cAMP-binding protein